MSVAKDASQFVAAHSKTHIDFSDNVFFGDGRPETRPARTGIEFRLGTEERVAAANTAIQARLMVVVVGAAEGPLGVCFARNVKFVRTERATPLGIALSHFCRGLHA